jgi:hypothetical protein
VSADGGDGDDSAERGGNVGAKSVSVGGEIVFGGAGNSG